MRVPLILFYLTFQLSVNSCGVGISAQAKKDDNLEISIAKNNAKIENNAKILNQKTDTIESTQSVQHQKVRKVNVEIQRKIKEKSNSNQAIIVCKCGNYDK